MYSLKLLNRQGSKLYKANATDVPKPRIKLERDREIEYIALEERENEGAEVGFVVGSKWVYPAKPKPIMDGLICWLDGRDGSNEDRTSVWLDRSGNGNHATLYNFDFTSTSGWTGKGLKFDGVNDLCKLDNFLDILDLLKDFEIECCFTNEMSGQNEVIVFGNPESGGVYLGSEYSNSQNFKASMYTGGSYNSTGSNAVVLNETAIISISKKNNTCHFRKNIKKNDSSFTFNPANYSSGTPHACVFSNASQGGTANNYVKGTIHSIKIYNRALTEAEILHNYEYEQNK